jgi:zinc/manganese transport system substrate-binding protein
MKNKICLLGILSIAYPALTLAKLNVVTSTTTLASIVRTVGGKHVKVHSITKGPQDPHFIAAKPSYMVKVRRADLVVAIGFDLEIGWLPNIIRGARNPKVLNGNPGYLEAGTLIKPLDVIIGKVDRAMGDVHALGNPHFLLDPVRAIQVGHGIAARLSQLDPNNTKTYKSNANDWEKRILEKQVLWMSRITKSGLKKVVSYHKTLTYFLNRFNLELVGTIESKPGIPPTAKHILQLIRTIKEHQVPCLLVESFFNTTVAERINKSVSNHTIVVPTEVQAVSDARDYESMMETLVRSVEQCQVGPK